MRGRVWMCGALQERTWVGVDTDVWADGLCICSMYVYMSLASSGKQCSGVADGRQGRQGRWQMVVARYLRAGHDGAAEGCEE
jgi:hypothetical protein